MDLHKSETNLLEPSKPKKWPQILATFIGEEEKNIITQFKFLQPCICLLTFQIPVNKR